jgi:hypothetical protein
MSMYNFMPTHTQLIALVPIVSKDIGLLKE